MENRSVRGPLVAAVVALLAAVPSAVARADQSGPLVGANYTELVARGTCGRLYILRHGHEPGARRTMRLQLAAMRAAGIEILRFFVWHDHDGAAFEAIPSAGGRLVEPYRGNFVAYLQLRGHSASNAWRSCSGRSWGTIRWRSTAASHTTLRSSTRTGA